MNNLIKYLQKKEKLEERLSDSTSVLSANRQRAKHGKSSAYGMQQSDWSSPIGNSSVIKSGAQASSRNDCRDHAENSLAGIPG